MPCCRREAESSRKSCSYRTTTAPGSPGSADLRDLGSYQDWHRDVEPLRDRAAAVFVVRDPFDVCTTALGGSLRSLMVENAWDLDSTVSRPRQRLNDDVVAEPNGR